MNRSFLRILSCRIAVFPESIAHEPVFSGNLRIEPGRKIRFDAAGILRGLFAPTPPRTMPPRLRALTGHGGAEGSPILHTPKQRARQEARATPSGAMSGALHMSLHPDSSKNTPVKSSFWVRTENVPYNCPDFQNTADLGPI